MLKRTVLVGSFAIALALTSSPAWANDFSASLPGGQVNWVDGSNRMNCHDTGNAAENVVCQLMRPNGNINHLLNTGGNGTTTSETYPGMTENEAISIRVCRVNGPITACSNWESGFS